MTNDMTTILPSNYKPTLKEKFMNAKQREYFRQKLDKWRSELLDEASETRQNLQETSISEADVADRASSETDRSLELRTRDRARKLISKIEEALERIEKGSYGYCIETDEPISIKRLEARPIATLSLEAQEYHEKMEKIRRDD
jgi:DnaK suppressor protein